MHRTLALRNLFLNTLAITALANDPTIPESNVRITDVAIIGGGASGTYAAVKLREDFNTSIVLVEPRSRLGGSVSTYLVPETNTTLEYGVQSYLPYGPTAAFFARFGISTQTFASRRLSALNVDVESGKVLSGYIPPSVNATNDAFLRWLTIVSKYEALLEPGYWEFPEPSNIPADFLVPFAEFAKLHQIEAAVPRIMTISGVGYGGVRDLLTFDIFQAFGATLTKDMLDNSLFAPVVSNSLLYQRAYDLLKSDILLSTTVQAVERTSAGLELVVTQSNTKYLIKARRVLYAAPPSLNNLSPFTPDAKEKDALSTWSEGGEYIGVAKIPCIPENASVTFLPSAAVPANYLALKDWPYNLRLDSTGPTGLGLFRVVFGANFTLTTSRFKELVVEGVQRLQNAGTVTGNCTTEFKAESNHSRPLWKQSAGVLQSGFVQKLYALQGYRKMWYTGYAWSAPYSSTIWAFTDTVLEKLLVDLKGT